MLLEIPFARLDVESLSTLFAEEGVTTSAGGPAVLLTLVEHLERTGRRCSTLERMIVGGAACPPSLPASFRKLGIRPVYG